jgi:hypothetical protein
MLHFVDFYPLWLRMQARWQCIKADARSAAFLHLAKKAPDNGVTSVPPSFSPSLAKQKGEKAHGRTEFTSHPSTARRQGRPPVARFLPDIQLHHLFKRGITQHPHDLVEIPSAFQQHILNRMEGHDLHRLWVV